MPPTNLLRRYGLSRNPFTDRTAEKTELNETSLYLHSDLQNFKPSEETYLFFGKRGSGKTTVRLAMQRTYEQANFQLARTGESEHFIVDLCSPGHLTSCLKDYQEVIGCTTENWDAAFTNEWTTADLVDCICAYVITKVVDMLSAEDGDAKKQAQKLSQRVRANSRIARRIVIMAYLYARCDQATLGRLVSNLHPWTWIPHVFPAQLSAPAALLAASALFGGPVAWAAFRGSPQEPRQSSSVHPSPSAQPSFLQRAQGLAAGVTERPLLAGAAAASFLSVSAGAYLRYRHRRSVVRAAKLRETVRVVKQRPVEQIAGMLDLMVSAKDAADTIRQVHIGISAHQKLDKLLEVVKLLGYQSLTIFGDCFDEVTLLDPVTYPGAIKQFAKEVCRNDLLTFGRMHFFFPDSRVNLDLTTDKTLKDARFDRHFVRDMNWSRHQLEELAERRFQAAQEHYGAAMDDDGNGTEYKPGTPFNELFKEVNGEDFAGHVGQLETPRELLIMMTEMFGRIESNPGGKLKAQDMEFAVKQAKQQSV